MEPKFEGDSNHYNFPSEPSLGGNQKQRDIPKIVPADLKNFPKTLSFRPLLSSGRTRSGGSASSGTSERSEGIDGFALKGYF